LNRSSIGASLARPNTIAIAATGAKSAPSPRAALREWPIEARLVYRDRIDGIEDAARARGIKVVLFPPWRLMRWKPRGERASEPAFHPLNFDVASLRKYANSDRREARGARATAAGAESSRRPYSAGWHAACNNSGGSIMRRIGRFLVRAGLLWFAVYVLAQAVGHAGR